VAGGDGVGLYQKELMGIMGRRWRRVPPTQAYPLAGALIKVAGRNLAKSQMSSYKQVMPMYLRSAAAVERRKAGDRCDRDAHDARCPRSVSVLENLAGDTHWSRPSLKKRVVASMSRFFVLRQGTEIWDMAGIGKWDRKPR